MVLDSFLAYTIGIMVFFLGKTVNARIGFLRDRFSSQAAQAQPIYDHTRLETLIDTVDDLPVDQKVGVEAALIRAACIIHMHERFGMQQGG